MAKVKKVPGMNKLDLLQMKFIIFKKFIKLYIFISKMDENELYAWFVPSMFLSKVKCIHWPSDCGSISADFLDFSCGSLPCWWKLWPLLGTVCSRWWGGAGSLLGWGLFCPGLLSCPKNCRISCHWICSLITGILNTDLHNNEKCYFELNSEFRVENLKLITWDEFKLFITVYTLSIILQ